jgi:hypothetical protein
LGLAKGHTKSAKENLSSTKSNDKRHLVIYFWMVSNPKVMYFHTLKLTKVKSSFRLAMASAVPKL